MQCNRDEKCALCHNNEMMNEFLKLSLLDRLIGGNFDCEPTQDVSFVLCIVSQVRTKRCR